MKFTECWTPAEIINNAESMQKVLEREANGGGRIVGDNESMIRRSDVNRVLNLIKHLAIHVQELQSKENQ